ncbi:MAG: MBG domain-containing protein [Dehalococcoidia bacterium]|nr:MBG domain-containing protein [Dehalococcoidia bacterium]
MHRATHTVSRTGRVIVRAVPAAGVLLLLALAMAAALAGTLSPASATDTGLCSPSANSNVGWDAPWDAYSSNDLRARADRTEDIVQYYNFNIPAIPSGATIDGIEVRVEGYQDGGTTPRQADISLSWDGGFSYTAGAGTGIKTTNMPGTTPWDEDVRSFGGTSDTWGRIWATDEFTNANFRVRLDTRLASTGHYLYVDHVQVRVYYRDGTTTAVASSANPSTYGDPVTFTATITRMSGTGTPTGTVQFWHGAVLLGTDTLGAVSDGVAEATLDVSSLDAGNHTITAVYLGDSVFGGSNGALSGGQTVNQRPITVTADAQSKIYGEADPALTYQITSGSLVGGDSFSGNLSRVAGENVGTYAIQQGTLTLSSNYDLTYVGANLNITLRPITVTADAQSKVYGNPDPALTYQITSGSLVGGDSFSGDLSRVAGEDVGAYAIQQGTLTLSTNYDLTYVGANLNITLRPITVTADAQSKVYGNPDPAWTYQITSGSLVGGDSFSGDLSRAPGEDVGAYTIQQGTLTLSSNYDLTFVEADLTITARALTITANDLFKICGATLTFTGTEFTALGLVYSDAVNSVTLTSAGADAAAPPGDYDIVPSDAIGTGLSNYDITYVNGTLAVRKNLTITANSRTKVYGSVLSFAGTEFTAIGLEGGDTVTSVTLTTSGAGAISAAGTYDIVPSAAVGSGLEYYLITYVNGTLTVTPKPLTVTANDRSKTYGDNLSFAGTEFTAVGLTNSDTVISVTLTSAGADAASAAGTYDIAPSAAAGSGLGNYAITYVNGTLTVAPRPLTITASDRTKTYGCTITFAGTEFIVEGLVNSDAVTSVTLTSAGAEAAAACGDYAILPSAASGTGLGNYNITYVNGNLTVRKAFTLWSVTSSPEGSSPGDPVTFTATAANPSVTGTVIFKDGGAVLGSATLGNGVATWTASDLSKGSHYITIQYEGDANFTKGTSLAHIHRVETPAPFPWWIIVVIAASVAVSGLFLWSYRRRRDQVAQPAHVQG